MLKKRQLKNIFSDKASVVLRAMLQKPEKHWKTNDFGELGVSFGLSSLVLNRAEILGYVQRLRMGPGSFTQMKDPEHLLQDWTRSYAFEDNPHIYYYYPQDDFLPRCAAWLREQNRSFALTLFSATRLLSPYVNDDRDFLYLDIKPQEAPEFLRRLETALGLKQLVRGGNVCLALPLYPSSVFHEARLLSEMPVVSNLQLYLDLMGFPPSGPEEARHFREALAKQGESLARVA